MEMPFGLKGSEDTSTGGMKRCEPSLTIKLGGEQYKQGGGGCRPGCGRQTAHSRPGVTSSQAGVGTAVTAPTPTKIEALPHPSTVYLTFTTPAPVEAICEKAARERSKQRPAT